MSGFHNPAKRSGKANVIKNFRRLFNIILEFALLIIFSLILCVFLLYSAKYLWLIFTSTPVGQAYSVMFPENYRITVDLLNMAVIPLVVKLILTACAICLIAGCILKAFHISKYVYSGRGILTRFFFLGLPLAYLTAAYLRYAGIFERIDTAMSAAFVPTLCVFSRCFQYTDEFVPELLDIIRRHKKKVPPVGNAGQKEDGFQRANGPGSEETQQRVEGSDVPFLSLKDIWDDNRVYIIAIPVIIVITTILFAVSQKHYFYKTDLISSKEAPSGETGDVTPDASGQRTVLTGTAGDWYGKALLLKESTDRMDILKAVDYLNQAIRLTPDDAEAYRMRGFFYGKLDRWNLAINDYDAAIRMKPRDGSLYTMRGNAYFALGKISLACSDAKKACTFGHCTLIREAKNDGDCL